MYRDPCIEVTEDAGWDPSCCVDDDEEHSKCSAYHRLSKLRG